VQDPKFFLGVAPWRTQRYLGPLNGRTQGMCWVLIRHDLNLVRSCTGRTKAFGTVLGLAWQQDTPALASLIKLDLIAFDRGGNALTSIFDQKHCRGPPLKVYSIQNTINTINYHKPLVPKAGQTRARCLHARVSTSPSARWL